MLDINNKIISKDELERKLNKVIVDKNIPIIKDDDSEILDGNTSKIATIRIKLINVTRQLNILDSCWLLSEDSKLDTTKKHFKKIRKFSKKVIRKMTRFLFRPIYKQQSEFNNVTIKALIELSTSVKYLADEIKDIEDELSNED